MRKLLLILSIIATLPLSAQEVRPARVINKPEEKKSELFAPAPQPRRGLMERIFGGPAPKPKPTPAPTPTPTPVAKRKAKITKPRTKAPVTREDATASPAVIAKPAKPAKPAETESPVVPAETPVVPPTETKPPEPKVDETSKPGEAPKPPPTKGKGKTATAKIATPNKPNLSNLDEAGKYQAVKAVALADEKLMELKAKADSTIDASEAKEASLEYNRALFKKIRALEPSLDAYVDRLEQAVIKRVK